MAGSGVGAGAPPPDRGPAAPRRRDATQFSSCVLFDPVPPVDDAGVYVADRENSRVQIFKPDGEYLREWTQFNRPYDLFIDDQDMIHIAEGGFHNYMMKRSEGPLPAARHVWHGLNQQQGGGEYPAVTLAVTKKPGENAIDVANAVMQRVEQLLVRLLARLVVILAHLRQLGIDVPEFVHSPLGYPIGRHPAGAAAVDLPAAPRDHD